VEKAEKLLLSLKELLEKEKKLLLSGIKGEDADRIVKLEERKLELLSELSKLSREDFSGLEDLVREIDRLNSQLKALIINNLEIMESIMEELFPRVTYGRNGGSTFEKRV